jgi:hypothetical protein
MPSWYTMIYSSMLFVSIILFTFSFFISGESKLGCSIAAYSCISVAIFMILGFSLTNLSRISNESKLSTSHFMLRLLIVSGPFLLLLGIIGYTLYLLITYQSLITNGNVTTEYSTFSTISIILIILEIYVFYNAMNTELFTNSGTIPKLSNGFMYLIGIINVVCVMILDTVLKYFTTDG